MAGKKEDRRENTNTKDKEEQEDKLGTSPTERKAAASKKCRSFKKLRHPEMLLKGNSCSDITEPLFIALPNIIIKSS